MLDTANVLKGFVAGVGGGAGTAAGFTTEKYPTIRTKSAMAGKKK